MRAEAANALAVLAGEPFWHIGRAADLVWLGFGPRQRVRTRTGGSKVVGRFALHLQCPWRITGRSVMVVGSQDLYLPPASAAKRRGWRWDKGPTMFDERVQTYLAESAAPLALVRSIASDRWGGFRLSMTRGLALEVFPADTEDGEYAEWWRLFRPGTNSRHIVISRTRVSS